MPLPTGPPKLMAAIMGAKATSTTMPPGIRTASDEPTSASPTHKTTPSSIPPCRGACRSRLLAPAGTKHGTSQQQTTW